MPEWSHSSILISGYATEAQFYRGGGVGGAGGNCTRFVFLCVRVDLWEAGWVSGKVQLRAVCSLT